MSAWHQYQVSNLDLYTLVKSDRNRLADVDRSVEDRFAADNEHLRSANYEDYGEDLQEYDQMGK